MYSIIKYSIINYTVLLGNVKEGRSFARQNAEIKERRS